MSLLANISAGEWVQACFLICGTAVVLAAGAAYRDKPSKETLAALKDAHKAQLADKERIATNAERLAGRERDTVNYYKHKLEMAQADARRLEAAPKSPAADPPSRNQRFKGAPMNGFLVNIALGLFLSEVSTVVGPLDPAAICAKVNAKVNAVITDTKIQATVDGLVDGVIYLGVAALKDESDVKALVEDAVSGSWASASAELKTLMQKALPSVPQSPATAEIAAILAA